MIGLEYILEVFKIQQKDLAEELGIKKQNITLWIKGKQNISKEEALGTKIINYLLHSFGQGLTWSCYIKIKK